MGLLGPSWDWEQIQKKDAIMGELRKENDRVLKEQRKILNNNSNSDTTNYHDMYERMRQSYDPRTGRTLTAKNTAKIQGNLAKHNYLLSLIYTISDMYTDKISIFIFAVIIIGILFYIFPTFTFWAVIVLSAFALLSLLGDFIKVFFQTKKITKTICYKGILEELKNSNFDDIKYIGICKSKIRIMLNNNSTTDYSYSKYNFPNLDFPRQSILLGNLLKDLKIGNKYNIKVSCDYISKVNTELFSKEEQSYSEYDQFIYVYAENKKSNNISKQNKKMSNDKKKDDLKNGKTW